MADAKSPSEPGGTSRHPTESRIDHRERLFDIKGFKADLLIVANEQFKSGKMGAAHKRVVFERGDSAAALLFDPDTREVVLVDQFRVATLGKGHNRGWVLETAAGIIRDGSDPKEPVETAEQCIIREIEEEVGYRVTKLTPIATFFPTPGGSSERISLFFAEIRQYDKRGPGGGVDAGEDIAEVRIALADFLLRLERQEFEDAKLIIAGQWLKDRRQGEESRNTNPTDPCYMALPGAGGKKIGFMTGDIKLLSKGLADVWVNSENSDMQMDRFLGHSISAAIRFMGAEKYPGTMRVSEDSVAEDLRRAMHGRFFVAPGVVLETKSGALAASHGVRRIFHVATVQGTNGEKEVQTTLALLRTCIVNLLDEVDGSRSGPHRSLLIPLLGTGAGGYHVKLVAPALIEQAIDWLTAHPDSKIDTLTFLGYSAGDGDALMAVMTDLKAKGKLV